MLIGAGYEVFGTTRNLGKTAQMEAIGVHPVLVDVFDRNSLIAAVGEAKPDVIIHQLTDLTAVDFAANDRLRIVGTRNLVDAAKAVGTRRMIAQSLAIVYAPGTKPATEQDPLADGSPTLSDTVKGVRSLETAVEELPEGVILRYGLLYGPGTWYSRIGPLPTRCGSVSDPPAKGSVHSFMWKTPRGRRCSRSTGQRVWSISSTTNLLPARNGCRASPRQSERLSRRWVSTAASKAPPIGWRGSLAGNRCTRPGAKGS